MSDRCATTIPLVVTPPASWDDVDTLELRRFFDSVTGRKLRDMLVHDVYTRALAPGPKDLHQQGRIEGANEHTAWLLSLADAETEYEYQQHARNGR